MITRTLKIVRVFFLFVFGLISTLDIAIESSSSGAVDGLLYILLFPLMVCAFLIDSLIEDLRLSLTIKDKVIRGLIALPYLNFVFMMVRSTDFQGMMTSINNLNSLIFPAILSALFVTGFYFLNNHKMVRKVNLLISIIGLALLIPWVLSSFFYTVSYIF